MTAPLPDLIARANELSTLIDSYPEPPRGPCWEFDLICDELELRGVILSDHVRCPNHIWGRVPPPTGALQ